MKIFQRPESLQTAYERWDIRTSPAIEANGLIYLSGLTATDADGEPLGGDDIVPHAEGTLEAIDAVLRAEGLSLGHVIKINCWLADPAADFAGWNAVFLDVFEPPYPARTTVGAPLVFGRIEVDAVAARDPRTDAAGAR